MSLKVLSLSTVFPNPGEPGLGIFVKSRLDHVAHCAKITVIAPVPVLDYGNPSGMRRAAVPHRRSENGIEILHPRWLYPPLGSVFNALCLSLAVGATVFRLRKHFGFELIDAHFGYPEGIAAALLASVFRSPFIVTLRGNETMHARGRLHRWAMRWSLRRAARVITVSESLRQFAIGLGVEAKAARTIPNGIDTGRFFPRDRMQARKKYGIDDSVPMILSAGYLIERKGHHRIIDALKKLREKGIDAQLVIAGGPGREGRFEEVIRQRVADHGLEHAVRFLGHVSPETLAELMSATDIFCLASSREGWPNVVHEAMACGAAIVTTDVGGTPDMVPSTEYGYVVPAGNQDALEEALARALGRQWDRDAISAWARSRSWTQVASEVIEEMRQVVAEKRV